MKVIICGAGQVGFNIARYLSAEASDITVIDQRAEIVQKAADSLDVQGIVGHASHPDVLASAGADKADMLIAVTHTDEINMVACQVAQSLFDVPTKIARVRNQSYLDPVWSDLYGSGNLPIDVIISPEIEVAQAIAGRFSVPGAFDVTSMADGKITLIGVRCTAETPILETPLWQLTELFPDLAISVAGIWRGGRGIIPDDEERLLAGDDVYFIADTSHVTRAMSAFGHEEKEARRVVILGGGNIGLYLATLLENQAEHVALRVIEMDRDRAASVAQALNDSVVLCGSALDQEVLDEVNIESAETVVAVTNDDETNILASLLAKRNGCRRAVTLINNASYGALTGTLGIDVVVSPRAITVSKILQHVRRGRIRKVHPVAEGSAEAIEAEALETSALVGVPLRDAHLPDGVHVGAIVRGGKVTIARGDTTIRPGDLVILFAAQGAVRRLEKLFSVKLEYF
ncbi:MAG: Trk system potassium transporter TrkA [Rhodospirillales bacterium]